MQIYDLVMLAVLAGSALFGFWKGLAWQVASIGSILLSYFVALNFRGLIASKLGLEPPLDTAVAMLILYTGSSLAVWLAFGFVSKSLKELRLKDWDHQIGALVGAAKGVLFCMLITVFAMSLGPQSWKETIPKSTSGKYIAAALTKTEALLPKDLHQMIAKYTDPVKSQLEAGREGGGLLGGEERGAEDLLGSLEKGANDLLNKAKREVGAKIESEAKKGAENLLRDLGKSVTDRLPETNRGGGVGGSTPLTSSRNSASTNVANKPTIVSPLGANRPTDAERPTVRMPDFSSSRWRED
jgi:membrane protein required for colicin V production